MNDFQEAAMLISSLYKGEISFGGTIAKVRNGKIKATPALADQLWVTHELTGAEDHPEFLQWSELRKEVQFRQQGVSSEYLRRVTQQFGPCYNRLSADGFLIPYSFDPSSIPSDGDGYFRGLRARASGDIDFFFEAFPDKPSLIFGQDLDVALVVAFHPSNQKLPTLSIEGLDQDGPDRPRWVMREKVWNPEWIGYTMLGQTLYAADYWLGQITGYTNKHFPTSEHHIPDPEKRAKATALLKEFELCGGHSDGNWNRVMLRPEDAYGSWQRTAGGDILCEIHRIGMGVDGANVRIKIDPETNKIEEDRSVNLNDPRFATGRAAVLFTQRYDDIAEMFPMFERGRQLVGLLKTLIALRDKYKFQPNATLSTKIDNAYRSYATRPPLTRQQRLCLPLSPEG